MKQNFDHILRQKLREELPGAPVDPWFVRKVLNRLPRRRFVAFTAVERAAYIMSAGLIMALSLVVGHELHSAPAVTLQSIFSILILTGGAIALIVSLFRKTTC